jgi:hypothetical protein
MDMILESSRGGLSSQMRITPRIDIERGTCPAANKESRRRND